MMSCIGLKNSKSMYKQLQEIVREHIIDNLCEISSSWEFDIDDNIDGKIIVGYGPNNLVIKTFIEDLFWHVTKELKHDMAIWSMTSKKYVSRYAGFIIFKMLFNSVFSIYGINVVHKIKDNIKFKVISKNKGKVIGSYLQRVRDSATTVFPITPYWTYELENYIMDEKFIDPLLLFLDPILYFKKYSSIIQKHPELDRNHTWGIYEILLGYFPEMNEELFVRYLALRCVFQNVCADIIVVITEILIELYI